jgi:hypothetical protein
MIPAFPGASGSAAGVVRVTSPRETRLSELLTALDESVGHVEELARHTQRSIGYRSFAPYHAYRAGIDEHRALVETIENALRYHSQETANRVRRRLLIVERDMLLLMVRSAQEFFFALSAIPNLPMGIGELFAQELQSLSSARIRLCSADHRDHFPPAIREDLETAEDILLEVMGKAPSLPSFELGTRH